MASPMSQQLIHTYDLILLDVGIGLCFLVLLKVGMVWGMAKLSSVLRDDDGKGPDGQGKTAKSLKAEPMVLSPSENLLWAGLSIVWLLSGLAQAIPQMVLVNSDSAQQVNLALQQPAAVHGLMSWFSGLWFQHPMGWNILSVVIQVTIAILLWMGRKSSWGQAVVVAAMAFGLFAWVVNGFGGLFGTNLGAIHGWPGSGLINAFALLLLLKPMGTRGRRALWGRWIVALYWGLSVIAEVLPENHLWSAQGMTTLFSVHSTIKEPVWWMHLIQHVCTAFQGDPGVWNGIVTVIMLALCCASVWRPRNVYTIGGSLVFLFLLWCFGQNLGLNEAYFLPMNTAPVIGILVWSIRLSTHSRSQHRPMKALQETNPTVPR